MQQELFELELTPEIMGNREVIRQNTQRGEEIFKIPIDKIIMRQFNVRTEFGDIQGLAHSLLENGQTLPGRVDVLNDGNFVITDGHRRFMALKMLEETGEEDLFFKAIVNPTKTTEEQRIIQMFTSQDSLHLKPHEIAELITRLIAHGHNQASVAKKIGKTAGYVSQMMSYSREDESVKEKVKSGEITVKAVLELQREMPDQEDRIKHIDNAVYSNPNKEIPVTAAIVLGKTNAELKQEKFSDIADQVISSFDLYKDQNAKSTIIRILGQYF